MFLLRDVMPIQKIQKSNLFKYKQALYAPLNIDLYRALHLFHTPLFALWFTTPIHNANPYSISHGELIDIRLQICGEQYEITVYYVSVWGIKEVKYAIYYHPQHHKLFMTTRSTPLALNKLQIELSIIDHRFICPLSTTPPTTLCQPLITTIISAPLSSSPLSLDVACIPTGLFNANYGPHGRELIHTRWVEVEVKDSPSTWQLQGLKIIGDANVPCNQLTFAIPLTPSVHTSIDREIPDMVIMSAGAGGGLATVMDLATR